MLEYNRGPGIIRSFTIKMLPKIAVRNILHYKDSFRSFLGIANKLYKIQVLNA
jgi:hypothetical protein